MAAGRPGRGRWHDSRVVAAALASAYGATAGVLVAALAWVVLSPAQRDAVDGALGGQLPALLAAALLLVVGLAALVGHLVGRYSTAVRALTAEAIMLEAHPGHRPPPADPLPRELAELGAAMRALAERRRVAEVQVAEQVALQVAESGSRLVEERNRLAALMSELAVAVVVCNTEGRILLYNAAARSLLPDETTLGIGRSVHPLVDRELVVRALDRLHAGLPPTPATLRHGDRVLRVRVGAVPAGFVLLLEEVAGDSHALVRGLVRVASRLRQEGAGELSLRVHTTDEAVGLDVCWPGATPAADAAEGWAHEPAGDGAGPSLAATVADHGGELRAGTEPGGPAYLRLVVLAEPPQTAGAHLSGATATPPAARLLESRPEFYDFDLFDRREPAGDWTTTPLAELAYTVLDTETTGLHPTEGDEVVSVGAVRIVNGRILRGESFERLVDPRRSVPAVATAVHGLTRSMLAGQPTIDTVLPELARYAGDTVLVGHNVGFDLQFLRLKEERTGVRLDQPVLDTLLLDAVVHPHADQRSLEAIAGRLGVPVTDRHSALGDALVTGEVFLRLLPVLDRRGIHTLGDALEASRSTLHSRLSGRMYDG
jgi:DNA polymerase III epsilon subunit family exonuclease